MTVEGDLDLDGCGDEPADAPIAGGALAYRGTVVRFAPGSGTGVLRTAAGREVPFDLEHCEVAPALRTGPREVGLSAGMEVGFDLGRTSRGTCVTRLFPAP